MYEYELTNACLKLLRDSFKLQKDETVVITVDTKSNQEVAEATAEATVILGAKPVVINIKAPRGNGKAGDPDLPIETLVGAIKGADAWVEYNYEWLFYSTVYDRAMEENKELKYMCLVGATPEMIINNIGKIDIPVLADLIHKVTDVTEEAVHVKITSPSGSDVEFDNKKGREFGVADGLVEKGIAKMLIGQIGWAPEFETINGVIVADGSINPPCGIVDAPVKIYVENGKVVNVEGGQSAQEFYQWMKSFDDPNMFNVAHLCYGLGPYAQLTGEVCEDERVWGCVECGFGNIGACLTIPDIPEGIPAASHSDVICLNSSVWLDGVQFLDEGKVVGPNEEIVALARQLGK